MKIINKLTISISEDDVKNIVADYLVKEGYNVTAEDVKLHVEDEWVGYGPDEHKEPRFRECTVIVKG